MCRMGTKQKAFVVVCLLGDKSVIILVMLLPTPNNCVPNVYLDDRVGGLLMQCKTELRACLSSVRGD